MWEFAIAMHKQTMTDLEAQKLWALLEHIDRVTTDHVKRERQEKHLEKIDGYPA